MKTTLQVKGAVDISDKEILSILKDPEYRSTLTSFLISYVQKTHGYAPKSIQYPKDNSERVVAIIDTTIDGGARPVGTVKEAQAEHASNKGFTKTWTGLYGAIGEVIDTHKKKKFISWDDLRAELIDMETDKGVKMFVKGKEELPLAVIKHRMSPSQLVRQAKNQPNLRGVQADKRNGGLKWG